MTTFTIDDVFLTDLAALIGQRASRDCYALEVPQAATPAYPYALLELAGGSWDRGMFEVDHAAGWRTVQATSIGKGADVDGSIDFLWLAGQIRAAFDARDLAGTSWQILEVISEGPPTRLESEGNVLAVFELFRLYVVGIPDRP